MSSNPVLDINGDTPQRLHQALALSGHTKAAGYAITNGRFVLYAYPRPGMIPFPAPTPLDDLVPLIMAWLATAPYPPEFHHDGDNTKGWRCARGQWGRAEGSDEHGTFVSVRPEWIMYGK